MLEYLESKLVRFRAIAAKPWVRRLTWIIAAFVFASLALLSFRALPDDTSILPLYVGLALLLVPLQIVLTGVEVRLLGLLADVEISIPSGIKLTLAGAMANLIPAPGSVAVRVGAVLGRGGTMTSAVRASLIIGLIWIGLSLLLGGIAIGAAQAPFWALLFAGSGIVIAVTGLFLSNRRLCSGLTLGVRTVMVETLIILTGSLRVLLIITALGYSGNFGQAVVVTMSSVVATATGFFPGGLGLSELLAGLTAPLTNLTPSVAVAAAILGRLIRFVGLAAMSVFARP